MTNDLVTTSELFELLAKATSDAVWHWDLDTNTIWWNEGLKTLFGHELQNNTSGPEFWYDFIHPDDKDQVVDDIHRLIQGGGTNWSAEYRFLCADGTIATVLDRGYVVHREGRAVRMVGAMQDITERVALQQERNESEERLRFALESAQMGTWSFDPARNLASWDERCERLLGWVKGDLSYKDSLQNIHPDDRERIDNEVQWALNPLSGGRYDTTFRTINAQDGKLRWVRFIGQTHFTETGQVQRFSGVAQEITAQVLVQEQVALMEQQARMAIESSGSGSFSIDVDTDQMLYSPSLARIFTGEALGPVTRNTFIDHLHPEDRSIRDQAYLIAGQTNTIHYEARFIWNDKSVHWVKVIGQYLFNSAGKPASLSGVALDITEQKEQKKALLEAEQRFSIAFNNASVGMSFTDEKGKFTVANNAFVQLLGYPAAELYTFNFLDLTHPDHQEENRRLFDELRRGERNYISLAKRYIRKDGSERWVQVNVTRIAEAREETHGLLVIANDISDRVEAEGKLRASEERFRRMINQAPVAIGILNARNMVIETANLPILELWGKDASIIGLPLLDALPESKGQDFSRLLEEVFDSGNAHYGFETLAWLHRNGKLEEAYFNFVYAPVQDVTDVTAGIIVVATEVTQQVNAKKALQESEQRFRTLMEAIAQMTWTNTPEGKMNFFNQRWYDYTGLDADQATTISWEAVVHPSDLNYTLEAYKKSLADGTDFVLENRYRRGLDGMYRWHLNRAIPIRDENGAITIWVGTATDIHEQKELAASLEEQVQIRTKELEASNYDLRRSNDNLEKFAYIASHDLQEPLRKIQSFGDILKIQYGSQLGEGVDHLERMQIAAGRMSLLIKDLLSFSRISTRQENAGPVRLDRLMTEVLDDLEVAIQQAGAKILVDELPTILGDGSQLRQLFQNLLSNALKFRKSGVTPHIQVQHERVLAKQLPASVKPAREAVAYYCIQVIDNGIGFDEKYIDRIFQVFQRLHGRSEYAGTGVGLAICEKVVANHGGAITALSQLGEGATFLIYLPVS